MRQGGPWTEEAEVFVCQPTPFIHLVPLLGAPPRPGHTEVPLAPAVPQCVQTYPLDPRSAHAHLVQAGPFRRADAQDTITAVERLLVRGTVGYVQMWRRKKG